MFKEIAGRSAPSRKMADGQDNSPNWQQDLRLEALKELMANLQVQIDVLRRAQQIAPRLTDELQSEIDQIERHLRRVDPASPR